MKKTYNFMETEEEYILKYTAPHDKSEPFIIKKSDMKFDSSKLYSYVFETINEPTEIEITDTLNDDEKDARRILEIIKEIVNGVNDEINKRCFK